MNDSLTAETSFAELRKRNRDATYAAVKNTRPDLYERVTLIASASAHNFNLDLSQAASLEASIMSLVREAIGA